MKNTTATNTKPAKRIKKAACICPQCSTGTSANGMYYCIASREFVAYSNNILVASGNQLSVQEILSTHRYQILSRAANAVATVQEADPEFGLTFDVAAATANTDAEIVAFISDVAAAQTPEPEYIPFIYYSAPMSGFVFGDEGRAYNNMTDADNARKEWLKSEASA